MGGRWNGGGRHKESVKKYLENGAKEVFMLYYRTVTVLKVP